MRPAGCAGDCCPGVWAERSGQRPLINARAETVATQPAFRESFEQRRCLIPADGFYEWRRDERRQAADLVQPARPRAVRVRRDLDAAGEEGRGPVTSCALITCEPNETVRPVHDRMPVVLDPDAEAAWLDPEAEPDELLELLRPAPEDRLELREVGDAVNDVRQDGPQLLEPPMQLF